jgi:hypothetical protein
MSSSDTPIFWQTVHDFAAADMVPPVSAVLLGEAEKQAQAEKPTPLKVPAKRVPRKRSPRKEIEK